MLCTPWIPAWKSMQKCQYLGHRPTIDQWYYATHLTSVFWQCSWILLNNPKLSNCAHAAWRSATCCQPSLVGTLPGPWLQFTICHTFCMYSLVPYTLVYHGTYWYLMLGHLFWSLDVMLKCMLIGVAAVSATHCCHCSPHWVVGVSVEGDVALHISIDVPKCKCWSVNAVWKQAYRPLTCCGTCWASLLLASGCSVAHLSGLLKDSWHLTKVMVLGPVRLQDKQCTRLRMHQV